MRSILEDGDVDVGLLLVGGGSVVGVNEEEALLVENLKEPEISSITVSKTTNNWFFAQKNACACSLE